jgi:hypothetical protein
VRDLLTLIRECVSDSWCIELQLVCCVLQPFTSVDQLGSWLVSSRVF